MATVAAEKKLTDSAEENIISALRVLATLWILLVHVHKKIPFPGMIGEAIFFGNDGASIYFFLTGYLVMNSWQNRASIKEYWRKRLRRLLPIYYFFLLVTILFKFDWLMQDPLSIPRAVFMLEYLAPPTVSYEYCSMNMMGLMAIFMTFYLLIPVLAKWIHSLDAAFVGFWGMVLFTIFLGKFYAKAYGPFCPDTAVDAMSVYFCSAIPYFAAGVLTYFAKKDGNKMKYVAYMLFIAFAGMRYGFLGLAETGVVCLLIGLLLCFPLQFGKNYQWGGVRWFDRLFGIGVCLSQLWCFALVDTMQLHWGMPKLIQLVLYITLPYCAAFLTHYLIEEPGAKLIDHFFKTAKHAETM